MNKSTRQIAQAAVFVALVIIAQVSLKPLGQYAVGSLVNTLLFLALLVAGLPVALVVALISPFLAFFLGVGPVLFPLVPLIALGNASLISCCFLFGRRDWRLYVGVVCSALVKFGVLYLAVVKIAVPLLDLKPKQAETISAMFTFPQLVTALIGGVVSLIMYRSLKEYLRRRK